MINVAIEREDCISCGQCWESCPEFFVKNLDDGLSMVSEKYRIAGKLNEGSAPDQFEDCLRQAEDACPAEVIHTSPIIQPSLD